MNESELDSVLDTLGQGSTHGVAVAAVKDGAVSYSRAVGMASIELAVPNSLRTRFRIASLTKQFLAYALLQLVDEGVLDLDKDLRNDIPALHQYREEISLRHLLENTSGLRDIFDLLVLRGQDIETPISDDAIEALLRRQQNLNFMPGSQFVYSNTGFRLASYLAEKATSQPLETILRTRIFEPIGMASTELCRSGSAVLPELATGYQADGDAIRKASYGLSFNGDAGLVSSVNDLVIWERALPKLRVLGCPLETKLSEAARYNNGHSGSYGLGTFSTTWRGLRVSGHGGLLPGFASKLLRFPEKDVSVIVLANSSDTDVVGLASLAATAVMDSDLSERQLPRDLYSRTGLYIDRDRDELLELAFKDGRAIVRMHAMEFPLEGQDDTLMRIKYSATDRELVVKDDGLRLMEGGEEHALSRLPRYLGGYADLDRFVGEFHSADLEAIYRISREADNLRLSINGPAGRSAYSLVRLEETLFTGCSRQGYWLPYQIAIRFIGEGRFDTIELTSGRTKSLRLSRSN
ncbi:serine hydrolase domain-containing protein [Hoeflea sp. Naph1]|uniref:serine hydrolase domain-containing protein n=1 Tax=Hoeflea sp. Naph1 TaxID=3388653 RepID=UPI00398FA565